MVITGYWALFNRSHTVDFVLLMALRKRHIVLYFSVSNDFLRLLFLATLKPFSLLYCPNQLAAIEYPRMLILEKGNDFMQQFLLHLGICVGRKPLPEEEYVVRLGDLLADALDIAPRHQRQKIPQSSLHCYKEIESLIDDFEKATPIGSPNPSR